MSKLSVHLLIVDHETMFRESLSVYLEDAGYHLSLAPNGQEGLKLFTQSKPDLLILDLDLPLMSGIEVMKAVRAIDPEIPILILTAVTESHEIIQALRLSIQDFLIKPLGDFSIVDRSIQKALEKKYLKEENEKIRHTLLEDQEAGKTVQEKTLPPVVYLKDDIRIEHHVEPMLYLSGDFVDYIELDDDHLIFYVCDVSGHGAAAAFVTVLIKMYIRELATAYLTDHDQRIVVPHLLLQSIAKEVHGEKLGKYCTMLYFVYYKKLDEIHYSVGGHYPNPVIIQKGEPRYLPGRGFPVGISASMSYKTEIIEVQPPFRIVLFSDGIFEILSGNFDDKDQHLLDLLKQTNQTFDSVNQVFKITTTPDRLDDISVLVFSKGESL